ncbi:MAG: hypothetical protein ACRD01_10150 [Terriglobales bacterium]
MSIQSRFILALAAFLYCVWQPATMIRHWAATPNGSLHWLLVAPAVACGLVVCGLAWEHQEAARWPEGEIPHWPQVHPIARWFMWFGFALLTWRSIWMFFSWDGMFLLPAWLLLALALYRWHERWLPSN